MVGDCNERILTKMMKPKAFLFFSRPPLPLLFCLHAVVLLLRSTPANAQPCTLCLDGTAVAEEFSDAPVFDFEEGQSTCAAFEAFAATIEDGSSEACRQLQDVGLSNCGCTTPDDLNRGCTLCPGGNDRLPEPEREVIPFVTCVGISRVIERFEEAECLGYQTIIGEACGCPDAPADNVCRICGGDTGVDFPSGAVDLSEIGLDNVPCIFYEVIANDQGTIEEGFPCEAFQLERETCCAVSSELTGSPEAAPSDGTSAPTGSPAPLAEAPVAPSDGTSAPTGSPAPVAEAPVAPSDGTSAPTGSPAPVSSSKVAQC